VAARESKDLSRVEKIYPDFAYEVERKVKKRAVNSTILNREPMA